MSDIVTILELKKQIESKSAQLCKKLIDLVLEGYTIERVEDALHTARNLERVLARHIELGNALRDAILKDPNTDKGGV